MRAWKQVDARDAHFLEQGSLKIGTWSDYARLESGRADMYDSAIAMHSGNLSGGMPHHVAALKRMGLLHPDVDPRRLGGLIAMNNTVIRRVPAQPVLCLTEVGNRYDPNPEVPKAIFEVLGVNTLAHRLIELHRNQLSRHRVAHVAYTRVEFDALDEVPVPDPDPFLKGEGFREEREIRLAFEPPAATESQTLFTTPDSQVAALLRRIA